MQQMEETRDVPWQERAWNIGTIKGLRAGAKAAGLIEHGMYADGTQLQNAVHVVVGREEGPVLYIQAAVHGDEVNGVEVLRQVITSLDPQHMRGVLIAVPVANGPGFVMHQRRHPADREDMNRVWPGKINGSLSQQTAYNLYNQAIRHAQYVVDLHTASSNTQLHVVYGHEDEGSRKLAEVFGLDILLEEEVNDTLKQFRFQGKLRNMLNEQGIPAITPELGGDNRLEMENVELGVRGVTNVLKYLKMIPGEIVPPDRPQITLHGSHMDSVFAHQGGFWIRQVKGGDRVTMGQTLGHIYSLRTLEAIEVLTAPYNGHILGTTDSPTANPGDSLVTICRVDA
ncbi:MAG: M14 family metallopeptidase [Ktedonobacteraceae bacterium]